jgi:hypothetical protein
MSQVLGSGTVDVLVERAVTEIGPVHPGLAGIRLESGQLSLAKLEQTFAEESPEEINAAFSALTGVMVLLLSRLLGRQIAEGIATQIDEWPSSAYALRSPSQ